MPPSSEYSFDSDFSSNLPPRHRLDPVGVTETPVAHFLENVRAVNSLAGHGLKRGQPRKGADRTTARATHMKCQGRDWLNLG